MKLWAPARRIVCDGYIEVMSPSSWRSDRVLKRDLYLENGVLAYWIVDLDARVIECWRPGQETPALHHDAIVWEPSDGRPLAINVRNVFDAVDGKVGRRRL